MSFLRVWSGHVAYPAAGLIQYYPGNRLVLLNKSETPYDRHADLVIRDPIGQVLGEIFVN